MITQWINGPHIVSCITCSQCSLERKKAWQYGKEHGEWCDAVILCWDSIKQTDLGLTCSPACPTQRYCRPCLGSELSTVENCGLADVDDIIAIDPNSAGALRRTLKLASERRYWRSHQTIAPDQALAHHAANGAVITCPLGRIRWVNSISPATNCMKLSVAPPACSSRPRHRRLMVRR